MPGVGNSINRNLYGASLAVEVMSTLWLIIPWAGLNLLLSTLVAWPDPFLVLVLMVVKFVRGGEGDGRRCGACFWRAFLSGDVLFLRRNHG